MYVRTRSADALRPGSCRQLAAAWQSASCHPVCVWGGRGGACNKWCCCRHTSSATSSATQCCPAFGGVNCTAGLAPPAAVTFPPAVDAPVTGSNQVRLNCLGAAAAAAPSDSSGAVAARPNGRPRSENTIYWAPGSARQKVSAGAGCTEQRSCNCEPKQTEEDSADEDPAVAGQGGLQAAVVVQLWCSCESHLLPS